MFMHGLGFFLSVWEKVDLEGTCLGTHSDTGALALPSTEDTSDKQSNKPQPKMPSIQSETQQRRDREIDAAGASREACEAMPGEKKKQL